MKGLAIIVPNADFSAKNLGKVTFVAGVEYIRISGVSNFVGLTTTVTATYVPSTTSQKGCIWSIKHGSDYAEIDQEGKVTIKKGANGVNITIHAVSIFDASVYADFEMTVTYKGTDVSSVTIDGESIVVGKKAIYTATVLPDEIQDKSVSWSIISGGNYASISSDGVLTINESANESSVTIRATSNYDKTKHSDKTVIVTYEAEKWYIDNRNLPYSYSADMTPGYIIIEENYDALQGKTINALSIKASVSSDATIAVVCDGVVVRNATKNGDIYTFEDFDVPENGIVGVKSDYIKRWAQNVSGRWIYFNHAGNLTNKLSGCSSVSYGYV